MYPAGPQKIHLFTPGPTDVPDSVLRAMSAPVQHHRTSQWQEEFGDVLQKLPLVFGTTEAQIAVFASSGTGALESAAMNLVAAGEEAVVLTFGRFGQRWGEILTQNGASIHVHETPWGDLPDLQSVSNFVEQFPKAKVIFTTHCETSTGAVQQLEPLVEAIREVRPDMLVVIDAVSSLGAVPVDMDAVGIDVVVSGSQKALMLPPGLAFAAISQRALEHAEQRKSPSFYYSWKRTLKAQAQEPPSTAFTPATTLVTGLGVALDIILGEGLDNVYARHVRHGRAVRMAVNSLGFELFSPDDDSSAVLTAVTVPPHMTASSITNGFKTHGITIAGGQAELKGKIFRLGHCGWINDFDIPLMIGALERVLFENGYPVTPGAGIAAAQKSLFDSLSHNSESE